MAFRRTDGAVGFDRAFGAIESNCPVGRRIRKFSLAEGDRTWSIQMSSHALTTVLSVSTVSAVAFASEMKKNSTFLWEGLVRIFEMTSAD